MKTIHLLNALLYIALCFSLAQQTQAQQYQTASSVSAYSSLSANGSSRAEVPNSPSLDITGPITVEAWFKTNSNTVRQSIVARFGMPPNDDGGYLIYLMENGKAMFATLRNGGDWDTISSNTTVSAGEWHHVAGVFDGTQMRIYLDGNLESSKASTSAPTTGTQNLRIGAAGTASDGVYTFFSGLIDEVRIASDALYDSDFTPETHLENVKETKGLWKFDDETVSDTSDNGNNGTLYGATFSMETPSLNNSLSLNGTSSYLEVPSNQSLDITGPLTVEAWIKTNSAANTQSIIERWGAYPHTDGGYALRLEGGKLRFYTLKNSAEHDSILGSTTISAGEWHHVAGVFDGEQLRVYVDGVVDGSKYSYFFPTNGNQKLKIGLSGSFDAFYFNGLIDEVRLTAGVRYAANFTPQRHLTADGVIQSTGDVGTKGLWKFDDRTTHDSSANGNHSTLKGSAGFSKESADYQVQGDNALANETPVYINFDDFLPGTMIANQYPDAKFSSTNGSYFVTQGFAASFGTSPPNYITGISSHYDTLIVDFPRPANNLKFSLVGSHIIGVNALMDIYQNDGHIRTLFLIGNGRFSTPTRIDVGGLGYQNITKMVIYNINDPQGLDYDDFNFTVSSSCSTSLAPCPTPSPSPSPSPTPSFSVKIHYQTDTGPISGSNQPSLVDTPIALKVVVLPMPENQDSYTWSATGPNGQCTFTPTSPCQLVAGLLSDTAIKLKFTQAGNYVVKVVHSRHNVQTPATVNLNVTQMQVSQVGFPDSYAITPYGNGTTGEWTTYDPLTQPVWKLDNTNYPDRPAAYKKGSKPHLFATYTIAPVLPMTRTVQVRVKVGTTVIATANNLTINANSNSLNLSDLAIATNLEAVPIVKTGSYPLKWELSFDGGVTWGALGDSGPHTIHWTYDEPKTVPFDSPQHRLHFTQVFDLALEKACGNAGDNASIQDSNSRLNAIIKNLNTHVYESTSYAPYFGSPAVNDHPLVGYVKEGGLVCDEKAMLLRGLLRSIGIQAETKYVWGGDTTSPSKLAFYFGYCNTNEELPPIIRGKPLAVTMRLARSFPQDEAPKYPHFEYHAVVEAGNDGQRYDPSYGDNSLKVEADEVYDYSISDFITGQAAANHLIYDNYIFSGGQYLKTIRGCPDSNCTVSNIIDDPSFFVRQQYLDIYNREPDPLGWAYWTGQITQCGNDGRCVDHKRVDVALAFFNESEAVQTDPRFAHPYTVEYNQAFVHQMYAGHLDRAVPDNDPGYLFWLRILNQQLAAEGTCDYWALDRQFVTCDEFRQRFGPL